MLFSSNNKHFDYSPLFTHRLLLICAKLSTSLEDENINDCTVSDAVRDDECMFVVPSLLGLCISL